MKKGYLSLALVFAGVLFVSASIAQDVLRKQRVIVLMMDGFAEKYYRASSMPFFNQMERQGIYKVVPSIMPAVTMVNVMSIASGTAPDENGITGNVYYDNVRQQEAYIEDPSIMLTPTIFEKAGKLGIKTAVLSVKKKTIDMVGKHADAALCPECGVVKENKWPLAVPALSSVYSKEVTYQIVDAAADLMMKDSGYRFVFIHTTDYPMHMWPPESPDAKDFLSNLDKHIAALHLAAPDAAILITADHGMNHKSFAWDLQKVCSDNHTPVKIVISAEKDRYVKHHKGLGGSAYVYLANKKDADSVRNTLVSLPGVELVLTRAEAAGKYHLMPDRIGDFMVTGNKETVFGDLNGLTYEILPNEYRSHGSAYEAEVPLIVYNAKGAPAEWFFDWNYKLAAWILNPIE